MPASYKIDTAVRVIFSKAEGRVTDEELLAHQDRLREDPAFNLSFDQIYDYSDVTEINVSDDTIRQLAKRQPFLPSVQRAFVVKSDSVRGLAQKFLAYAELDPGQVKIFDDMEAARQWLYLDKVRSRPPSSTT